MRDISLGELSDRVQDLERQNRVQRRLVFGLAAGTIMLLTLGAGRPAQNDETAGKFDTVTAKRVVITDSNGSERLTLELASGEPAISMFNHKQQRQIFLGIDEDWQDTALLSVSSRQSNGEVDKQAVLAATTGHPQSPGNSQLILYDAKPMERYSPRRELLRLSSGRGAQKPYVEVYESTTGGEREVNLTLLQAAPGDHGVLLNTDAKQATLTGVTLEPR